MSIIKILELEKNGTRIRFIREQYASYDIYTVYVPGKTNGRSHYNRFEIVKVFSRLRNRGFAYVKNSRGTL